MTSPSQPSPPRSPKVFSADDPNVSLSQAEPEPEQVEPEPAERSAKVGSALRVPTRVDIARTWSWGSVFVSAAIALSSLALTLWFTRFVSITLSRDDWIGWIATGLMAVMALAAMVMILREVVGLFRLRRITKLRRRQGLDGRRQDAVGERDAAVAIRDARP